MPKTEIAMHRASLNRRPPQSTGRKVFGLGIDYRTSEPLFPAVFAATFFARLKEITKAVSSLRRSIDKQKKQTSRQTGERGLMMAPRTVDLNNPGEAGWTYLYSAQDPSIQENVAKLNEFARHRLKRSTDLPDTGDNDTELTKPLIYGGENQSQWLDWLKGDYLKRTKKPKYILILGGPKDVPFGLQSLLSSIGCYVGRLSFDLPDDYGKYIDKVIELEGNKDGVVQREAYFFATDHGSNDPTHYCRVNLVDPLIYYVKNVLGLPAHEPHGGKAIKQAFFPTKDLKSGLVFIAAHGLANAKEIEEDNGAIYCPAEERERCLQIKIERIARTDFFSAIDIPQNGEFYYGSAFFNFGCFSYGTPARSDIAPLVTGDRRKYHPTGFVAALPKKLLAHSSGPIAYIGHLDTAYLNGFIAPKTPRELLGTKEFIGSYTSAVNSLLSAEPVGRALRNMNKEFVLYGQNALDTYDDWNANVDGLLRSLQVKKTSLQKRFIESWIRRNNTRNFMLLGDPGARLSIWKEE